MSDYGYIWEKLYAGVRVFMTSDSSLKRRAALAIASGVGRLKAPMTHIPPEVAPRLEALHASIDRIVETGLEAQTEVDLARFAEEWLSLYNWVCHMRGPDHA